MPECVLCNSQNFDVMDGLFFCIQCGTQSQDVREEVNDIDADAFDAKLSVKKTNKRQKKVYDCGKPWFTLEGFQVVIKAQIEFLMKIGVDPAIKDVIGQMWFTFVERSTNAFGTRQDENFAKMTKRRDTIIKDFTPTDSIHRKTPKFFGVTQQTDDGLELSSEIAREDFYEDDDPTGGLFEDGENVESSSHIGSVDQTYRKNYTNLQAMTLQHTLAFCFLGLLWIQEPICLSDLIRWAVEGHLPYFNASTYFPSHMKLSQSDIMMFTRSSVPIKDNITTLAGKLSRYITLPDIPRHQINIYIARYAIDLQLPACIHRYISRVVEMIDMDLQSLDGLLNYDDLAMAYIIISLRLIYGLDDVTEHELSKLATDIEQEDENPYFPAWNDLIETIHTSQCIRLEHGVPWNKEDLSMLKDCRNYSKFCKENLFGSWKPECTVHRYKRQFKGIKGLNAEKQKEYANMFGLLLKTDEEDEADEGDGVTSFPFLSAKSKATKSQTNDEVSMEPTNPNFTQVQGLCLDSISSYYERKTTEVTSGEESGNQIHKNRYIRYDFPVAVKHTREVLRAKWWNDATLPGSLRQLVEICSKLIYCEPTLLFNVIQMLEKKMFGETDK